MRTLISALGLLLGFGKLIAQAGNAETMIGNKYLQYQHVVEQSFKSGSRFRWQHIASFIRRHNPSTESNGLSNELMNQAYLVYRLYGGLSAKGGLFYSNATDYAPSLSIQLLVRKKDWTVVVSPRADVKKNMAYEMYFLSEYSPELSATVRFYSRIQAMTNLSARQHNRSYQQVRIGIDVHGFQLGIGLTLDEYGTKASIYRNMGFFIRKKMD